MKSKTKKRIGIIAMMVLLVVAIAATAGTTLAKYISSATVTSQTATVAKWGYTITTNAEDLFSKQYNSNVIVDSEAEEMDVKASAKVVAPGTSSANSDEEAKGALVVTVNGYAEVKAQLVIDITAFNTVWLDRTVESVITGNTEKPYDKLGSDVYYPLDWTITAGGETANLTFTETDADDLADELAAQIAANLPWANLPEGATVNTTESKDGKVVIDLEIGTKFEDFTFEIAWKWLFTHNPNTDVEDTILGWLAAGDDVDGDTVSYDGTKDVAIDLTKYDEDTDYNLEVALGCTIQIVQVQNS